MPKTFNIIWFVMIVVILFTTFIMSHPNSAVTIAYDSLRTATDGMVVIKIIILVVVAICVTVVVSKNLNKWAKEFQQYYITMNKKSVMPSSSFEKPWFLVFSKVWIIFAAFFLIVGVYVALFTKPPDTNRDISTINTDSTNQVDRIMFDQNHTKRIEAVTPESLSGYWFTPHAAIRNIIFYIENNKFEFGDGGDKKYSGSYVISESKVTLHFDEKTKKDIILDFSQDKQPLSSSGYLNSYLSNDDANGKEYFVHADDSSLAENFAQEVRSMDISSVKQSLLSQVAILKTTNNNWDQNLRLERILAYLTLYTGQIKNDPDISPINNYLVKNFRSCSGIPIGQCGE